jgi:hypothetical protein
MGINAVTGASLRRLLDESGSKVTVAVQQPSYVTNLARNDAQIELKGSGTKFPRWAVEPSKKRRVLQGVFKNAIDIDHFAGAFAGRLVSCLAI